MTTPTQPESGEAVLVRFGLQWNGPREFVSTPMVDGYWTPWHIAHEALTSAQQRIAEAEQERDALLSDWNAIVAASGSPTHGGAVGVVAEHRRRIRELEGLNAERNRQNAVAFQERDRLREALREYGGHLDDCAGMAGALDSRCTCGFRAALTEVKEV